MPRRFHRSLILAPLALASLGVVGCSSPSSSVAPAGKPAPAARSTSPVTTAAPVMPLPASLHPAARPERDLGRMDPGVTLTNLALLFERLPSQQKLLARDLVAIQDPTSPAYHRWISPEEFGLRYGASPLDVARATAWLRSQGFFVLGRLRRQAGCRSRGRLARWSVRSRPRCTATRCAARRTLLWPGRRRSLPTWGGSWRGCTAPTISAGPQGRGPARSGRPPTSRCSGATRSRRAISPPSTT